MPQIDLGKLRFDWKGTWSNSVTYELNDVVKYTDSIYVALGDVSAGTAPTDTNYWELMLEGIDATNYDTSSEVDTKIANLVDSAPGTLDTLNELAAALNDDADFATTVSNQIAGKADSAHTHSVSDVTNLQTELDSKVDLEQTVFEFPSGNPTYTIGSADKGVLLTNSEALTITVDDVLQVGEQVDFLQMAADQITFVAGSGVTLNSKDGNLKTAAQYSPASVKCIASGIYVLVGDLGA